MVALVISLLLLAGLVTVFASVHSSYGTTSQLNCLVNQERLASDVIGNTLANAGYFPLTNRTVTSLYPSPLTAFPSLETAVHTRLDFVSGQVIYGTGATTPGSRDVVAIRMLTAPTDKGNILDCQGSTSTAGDGIERSINVLWIDPAKNQLMCSTSTDPGGTPIIGGDRLPVKGTHYGGVNSLVAVYGVDTNADGSVDRYMSAGTLKSVAGDICPDVVTLKGNSSSCWPYVRSVRITLGMVSALAPDEVLHFTRSVVLANAIGRNVNPPGLYVAPAPGT